MPDNRLVESFLFDKLAERDNNASHRSWEDAFAGALQPPFYGSSDSGGMTPEEFDDAMRRELRNLLSTKAHRLSCEFEHEPVAGAGFLSVFNRPMTQSLGSLKHASTSVLSYGIPDTAGLLQLELETEQLRLSILNAIRIFEPRIDSSPEGLQVQVVPKTREPGRSVMDSERRFGWHRFIVIARVIVEPLPQERIFRLELMPAENQVQVT